MSSKNEQLTGKCPLLSNPCDECFCVKMDSQSIASMLEFCAGEWEKCEVYLKERNAGKQTGSTNDDD